MNEHQIGFKIKQHLNQGLDLDAEKLARLKAAREQALARQSFTKTSPLLAWADNVTGRFGGPGPFVSRVVVPTSLLILGLIAIFTWNQLQQAKEIEEIDTAVLTGDLPLDAYLDKGFDAWLRRFSQ